MEVRVIPCRRKYMKRKFKVILLSVICLMACLLIFAGCGTSINGKYINESDKNSYITLENGKWQKSDSSSGDYTITGDNIVFKIDGEEVLSGTYSNGKIVVTEGETSVTYTKENEGGTSYMMWAIIGIIVVLFVVWMFFSGKKSKRRQKEYFEQLAAIGPGNKVKTAGGICGIVVEVCDDNTVIIETGSETSGKSYVKMDKELIAQTDAKGPTQLAREAAEAAKRAPAAKPEQPAASEESAPAAEEPKAEEPAAPEEK